MEIERIPCNPLHVFRQPLCEFLPIHHFSEVLSKQLHQLCLKIRHGDRVHTEGKRSRGIKNRRLLTVKSTPKGPHSGTYVVLANGWTNPVFERIVANGRRRSRFDHENSGQTVPHVLVAKICLSWPSNEHDTASPAHPTGRH